MRKIFLGILFIISISNAQSINIAVAANVSYAIESLKKEFKRSHPDIKVNVTLGSSGKLTAQIKNGAPYDLFMSANMKYPESLYKNGRSASKPIVYARGSLALLSNKQRSFHKGIYLTKSALIKRIAVANPKTAPYGKAAFEAFKNASILDSIEKKLIYGESVSQTVSYTMMGADVGFIAKSSLYSSKMKRFRKNINWIEVDPKLYTPIDQGIIITQKGINKKGVKAFYDFILSKNGKKIFKDFGYMVP